MRQGEAVGAEQQADDSARIQRQRRAIGQRIAGKPAEHKADKKTGGNPTDGAEHPDHRKLPLLVVDVVKRQRVRQSQSRHVAQVVQQQQQNEHARRCRGLRHGEHDQPAQQVQRAEHFLRREKTVGNEPQKERRDDGRDGVDRVRPVREVGHALCRHVVADRDVPRPPDEKLQEHHRAKSRRNRSGHAPAS